MNFKLIHPRFQFMVIAFGLCIGLLCTLLMYLSIQFFFERSFTAIRATGLPPDHAIYFFLNQQRTLMNGVSLLVFVASSLASIFVGWMLSNRVARPLKEMQEHFASVTLGRMPTRLHFRKVDFFQEVADAYNEALAAIGLLPRDKRTIPPR